MVTQTIQNREQTKRPANKAEAAPQATGEMVAHPRYTAFAPMTSYDPFHRFRDEFHRLFQQFVPSWPVAWEGGRREGWGLDVREDDQTLTIRAEAPGFEASEFDVEVRDNQLMMCACHKTENMEESSGTSQWESREFHHSLLLPSGIDTEKVDAEYHNGILSVKFPKTAEAKGRHIPVKG